MDRGISEAEISAMAEGHSEALRKALVEAAKGLNFSLKYIDVSEDWKELLELFRSECVGPWITVVIDGVSHPALVDTINGEEIIHSEDFRYDTLGPQMRRLYKAIRAIETFDARMHDSGRLRSYIGTVNAGLRAHDQKTKAMERIRKEYLTAIRGKKKLVKASIISACDISPRTFDYYVQQVKKSFLSQ